MSPRFAVFIEVALSFESKAAGLTGVGPFIGMDSDMFLKYTGFGKLNVTEWTAPTVT